MAVITTICRFIPALWASVFLICARAMRARPLTTQSLSTFNIVMLVTTWGYHRPYRDALRHMPSVLKSAASHK